VCVVESFVNVMVLCGCLIVSSSKDLPSSFWTSFMIAWVLLALTVSGILMIEMLGVLDIDLFIW
jgi:hypothetical protein